MAQGIQSLRRYLADHANGKTRARERVTPDPVFWQSQLPPNLAHLIFEKIAQWLYQQNGISSGNPPTLWCVLIRWAAAASVALVLSITSG